MLYDEKGKITAAYFVCTASLTSIIEASQQNEVTRPVEVTEWPLTRAGLNDVLI